MYQDTENSDLRRGHRAVDAENGARAGVSLAGDGQLLSPDNREVAEAELVPGDGGPLDPDSGDVAEAEMLPGEARALDPPAGGFPAAEVTGGPPTPPDGLDRSRLVPAEVVDRLRDQWRDAQSMFVDDPPAAVVRTRTLLTDFVRSMADQLDERGRRPGPDVSTEDLRQELRQYRDAFDQLAKV